MADIPEPVTDGDKFIQHENEAVEYVLDIDSDDGKRIYAVNKYGDVVPDYPMPSNPEALISVSMKWQERQPINFSVDIVFVEMVLMLVLIINLMKKQMSNRHTRKFIGFVLPFLHKRTH